MSVVLAPRKTKTTGWSAADFEGFLAARNEADWITARRTVAFENYRTLCDIPLDEEEFKRLDLRTFDPSQFLPTSGISEDSAFDTLLRDEAEYGGSIVHVDGHTTHEAVSHEISAQGVLFGDLHTLLTKHRDKLEPYLQQAVAADSDRLAAWHAAFRTGGTLLFVPDNVEVKLPLHSLIGLRSENAADLSHTLIVVGDNAHATLLEETANADPDTAGLHVGCVELIVGRNANLRYVQLQNWNQKTWHLAHQAGTVADGGSLQWTVVGLGSRLSHIHQDINLNGRGSFAEVNGISFTSNRQKLSYYTQQHHKARDTRSDLLYKEVLRDESRLNWRGMIKVDPVAQLTDGFQRSDALMLSDDARCDAIPGLEIEADDVRCTHAATTGRVDAEQVFYSMSRGLSRKEAMHMIVEGFFQQVYDRIPIEIVRETLSRTVQKKLGIEAVAEVV